MRRARLLVILVPAALLLPVQLAAQTTVYHLHQEASVHNAAYKQLKTGGPEPPTAFFDKNLKNLSPNQNVGVAFFETQPAEPIPAGDIPAGTVVTFSFWMKKTANFGVSHPAAALYRNHFLDGTLMCGAGGSGAPGSFGVSPALTLTLTKYTLNCTMSSAITMSGSDRLHLAIYAWIATGAGNKNEFAQVHLEGVLDGNYDSTVTVAQPPPPPTPPVLAGLSPVSGVGGTPVTVTGTYFGATQGASTLKFNGITATPTSWSANSITAPVPAPATSGPIIVTVGGLTSNPLAFTVTSTGSVTGTVSRATGGTPIDAASVQILQSGVVKASATTNTSGQYTTGTLPSGFYDASITAAGFAPEVVTSFSVGGGSATTVNVAMKMPGTLSGTVTQQGGGALAGVGVTASINGVALGSTTTDATGNYSLNLKPGTYTVEASAPSFSSSSSAGAVVTESGSTNVNLALASVAPTTITYTYDEVGRLVGVMDATGDTARYTYDSVGNQLTITRQPSSQVSILEFSPNSGPVGTPVTLHGTGFSTTPSQNTVTFNSTPAVVTNVTPTQLSVTVPAAATTGPVAVTTPSGSGTGPGNFTVAASLAPAITGFTPSLAVTGTAINISGVNFQSTAANNAVSVSAAPAVVTSSTPTSIASSIPSGARSGRVRVATPYGVATSSSALFVVPAPHVAGDVAATAFVPYDTPTVVPLAAGKISIIAFDGVANQRASVLMTNGCVSDDWLYDTVDDYWLRQIGAGAAGNPTGTTSPITNGRVFEARVLPYTGSYQVTLEPCTGTSSVTVTVKALAPDPVGTIVPGGPPVVSTTTASWQNARLTFNGTANQRVSFNLSSSGFTSCGSGAGLFSPFPLPAPGEPSRLWRILCQGFVDPIVLPYTGTYTLFLNPDGEGIGTLTSTLYDVPADLSGPITPGSPLAIETEVPGQNGAFTFSGVSGQRVSLLATNSTYPGNLALQFKRADGTVLLSANGNYLDATELPAAETYTLFVDPWTTQVGDATLTLYDIPADTTGSTTVNGTSVPFTTATPGHNASITFPGSATQSVTIRGTGNTIGCTHVRLLKPDGILLSNIFQCGGTVTLGPITLPTAGTYTIQWDPFEARMGSVTISVTNP